VIYTKEMLLAVGDRYETQIAADRAQDAPYR
jgi:NADH-quinone oxidoreductase subunit I